MATKLTVGARLGSVTSDAEVIVVRPPSGEVELTCGGAPMVPVPAERSGAAPEGGEATLLGKRYEHAGSGLELLCTKGGDGALCVDGVPLTVKAAKNLPSSD